jgi:aminoglycoside 6-adenylyltransferase
LLQPDTYYPAFAARLLAWAETRQDIRAILQVGSRTRSDHPADCWGDADFMIYTTQPEAYIQDSAWVSALGDLIIMIPSRTAGGDTELLALYAGGYNVDLVLLPLGSLHWLVEQPYADTVYQRGGRILLDRDGLGEKLLKIPPRPVTFSVPDESAFRQGCETFWYASYYFAKQLRRGDLWLLKLRDAEAKRLLLGMLELHARSVLDPLRDTWHMGRFIQEWADPRAVAAFQDIFAHYDAADSWFALRASMRLFSWLARETALKLGYAYPQAAEETVTALVEALQAEVSPQP